MENGVNMKRVSWVLSLIVILMTIISIRNNRQENPNFLDAQLLEVEHFFAQRGAKNKDVSQADVAWHLDHTLKTINRIIENLVESNPDEYRSNFNVQRIVVHTSGIIPRGVAQSPQNVRPPDIVLLDSLQLQLEEARKNLDRITELEEKAFFVHPVFNHLDRDQTRRFLEIHTNHHLKIIRDILGE